MNDRTNPNQSPQESKKDKAMSFLRLVSQGEVREAYNRYIGEGFRHHNPFFRGDAESLKHAMEEEALKNPHKTLEVKRTLEEGELVVVHSHIKEHSEDPGVALVHFFRFQEDYIIELWDLGQPIPDPMVNENGVF